ncbi:MAG TPA: KUP/HAK/KT family potassium transporter [Bryobacteraceae bacterium]|nr:KUP/HAK/KT family potassium transporter [Bryobacteraceae bacterium]
MSDNHGHKASFGGLALGALGVVFGDIGTSPLYTLKECLHAAGKHQASEADLYGVLSLIFWSLTLVVTVKYLTFIMKADNRGEGGIFALLALVPEHLRTAKPGKISAVALFAVMGAALLYGDGIITPAISVLGAVEGLAVADARLAPAVVPVSCLIIVGLFLIQSRGTGTVGKLFGPVMIVWFSTLASLGVYHIAHNPEILSALSPHHAVLYFMHHGFSGIHILASVVLAVTGGEALYADMGHFGIKPIRAVWLGFVMPSLLLAYFGQGANALRNPHTMDNPFFAMVPAGWATYALVVLSSMAAIIASQALISGAFSLTRQAMQLGYFPRVQVLHTARQMEGQIYIPQVNYFLAFGCLALVLAFRESSRLAAAYGIAVTGTMVITSAMYFLVSRKTWNWPLSRAAGLLVLFLAFDLPFLWANLGKFHDGGWVPVLIGAGVLVVMILWNRGRTLIAYKYRLRFPSKESARERVDARLAARVPGTAVFMASSADMLPPVLVHHVERSRALQQTVILLTIQVTGEPYVDDSQRYTVAHLEDGFHRIVVRFGFMEQPMVMPILEEAVRVSGIPFGDRDVTYYLGRENFVATSRGHMGAVAESIFSFLQKNAVAADRFFGLPHRHVVEIGTQMDL